MSLICCYMDHLVSTSGLFVTLYFNSEKPDSHHSLCIYFISSIPIYICQVRSADPDPAMDERCTLTQIFLPVGMAKGLCCQSLQWPRYSWQSSHLFHTD